VTLCAAGPVPRSCPSAVGPQPLPPHGRSLGLLLCPATNHAGVDGRGRVDTLSPDPLHWRGHHPAGDRPWAAPTLTPGICWLGRATDSLAATAGVSVYGDIGPTATQALSRGGEADGDQEEQGEASLPGHHGSPCHRTPEQPGWGRTWGRRAEHTQQPGMLQAAAGRGLTSREGAVMTSGRSGHCRGEKPSSCPAPTAPGAAGATASPPAAPRRRDGAGSASLPLPQGMAPQGLRAGTAAVPTGSNAGLRLCQECGRHPRLREHPRLRDHPRLQDHPRMWEHPRLQEHPWHADTGPGGERAPQPRHPAHEVCPWPGTVGTGQELPGLRLSN